MSGWDVHDLEQAIADAGFELVDLKMNFYDGLVEFTTKTVFVDLRLLRRERRSTLSHELAHIERGYRGFRVKAEEKAVELQSTRRLVTVDDILEMGRGCTSTGELALALDVDGYNVEIALKDLSPTDRERVAAIFPDGLRRADAHDFDCDNEPSRLRRKKPLARTPRQPRCPTIARSAQ